MRSEAANLNQINEIMYFALFLVGTGTAISGQSRSPVPEPESAHGVTLMLALSSHRSVMLHDPDELVMG